MTTATATKANTLTVNAAILDNLLSGAILATDKDKSMPTLNCVMIESHGGKLIAAATDRYRIHEGRADSAADFKRTLIMRDDVTKIRSFLKDKIKHRSPGSGDITLAVDENDLITVSDIFHNSVTCRGQLSTFPPYEHLIPTEFSATDTIGINPSFLADLAKIPSVGKNSPMILKLNGPNKPLLAEVAGEVSWRVLVMPMKSRS
jgi:DNA polymerase III sliding clamp (beta) subunit (PCNA family)